MFNPFFPLNKELLDALVKAGKVFFVRQTYTRGKNEKEATIKFSYHVKING